MRNSFTVYITFIFKCFEVCRGEPIDLVEMDARRQRMVTVSGSLLKVWNLKGHRVLKELRCVILTKIADQFLAHIKELSSTCSSLIANVI